LRTLFVPILEVGHLFFPSVPHVGLFLDPPPRWSADPLWRGPGLPFFPSTPLFGPVIPLDFVHCGSSDNCPARHNPPHGSQVSCALPRGHPTRLNPVLTPQDAISPAVLLRNEVLYRVSRNLFDVTEAFSFSSRGFSGFTQALLHPGHCSFLSAVGFRPSQINPPILLAGHLFPCRGFLATPPLFCTFRRFFTQAPRDLRPNLFAFPWVRPPDRCACLLVRFVRHGRRLCTFELEFFEGCLGRGGAFLETSPGYNSRPLEGFALW